MSQHSKSTIYIYCIASSPYRGQRENLFVFRSPLRLVVYDINLDKVSSFCFLRDQLISYTAAEKVAGEENLCLPPAFACFDFTACVYSLT